MWTCLGIGNKWKIYSKYFEKKDENNNQAIKIFLRTEIWKVIWERHPSDVQDIQVHYHLNPAEATLKPFGRIQGANIELFGKE